MVVVLSVILVFLLPFAKRKESEKMISTVNSLIAETEEKGAVRGLHNMQLKMNELYRRKKYSESIELGNEEPNRSKLRGIFIGSLTIAIE